MKYSDTFSISLMCDVFGIPRSSFYHYFYYSTDNSEYISTLLIKISKIFFDSKRTYGSPRITAVLRKEGYSISTKTVAKYMKILELESISKANFPKKKSYMDGDEKRLITNLIKNIDICMPNLVWTTDITYIKTKQDGTVYLSSIMDLFSRKIIAWNVDFNMKKEMVIFTLNNAFAARNFPTNLFIHSDKGAVYRSTDYRIAVIEHDSLFSYTSLNHSCDENANQESFHATIKKEWLYNQTFNTIEDVRRAVFEYIEGFYNTKRIHSSLGYLSPCEFENQYYSQNPPQNTV